MYIGDASSKSQRLDWERFMFSIECIVRARPELVESLPGAIFFPKCPYCSMLETELGYWGKRAIELVGGGRDGSMLCLAEGCTCCVTDRQTSVGAIGGMHKILWVDRPFIAINVFNFCCWGDTSVCSNFVTGWQSVCKCASHNPWDPNLWRFPVMCTG